MKVSRFAGVATFGVNLANHFGRVEGGITL
jgi:hypothetical protein